MRAAMVPEGADRVSRPPPYTWSPMAATIMIVEDEPAVARGVQVALQREGYAVTLEPTEDTIQAA